MGIMQLPSITTASVNRRGYSDTLPLNEGGLIWFCISIVTQQQLPYASSHHHSHPPQPSSHQTRNAIPLFISFCLLTFNIQQYSKWSRDNWIISPKISSKQKKKQKYESKCGFAWDDFMGIFRDRRSKFISVIGLRSIFRHSMEKGQMMWCACLAVYSIHIDARISHTLLSVIFQAKPKEKWIIPLIFYPKARCS